jgi:hypothetical protein
MNYFNRRDHNIKRRVIGDYLAISKEPVMSKNAPLQSSPETKKIHRHFYQDIGNPAHFSKVAL